MDDYGQGISIADLLTAPNAETLGKNIANPLAARSMMRFASASARTAALTGVSAPVEGMLSYLQDTNKVYLYEGSSWVELARYQAPVLAQTSTNMTFTGSTFANGSSPLSAVIVMPPSGKIHVNWGVRCDNTVGANTLTCPIAAGVVTGIVYSPTDDVATQWANTVSAGPFVGLQEITAPAGESVTVTLQHRIAGGGGTSNLRYRYIRLIPV
ncbi:hypothetical protein EAO71_33750 [Streptomyces sp. ms191]|nr:hypothetical protein EAO71_33750 [Streptomyces sp. ms191]